MQNRLDVFSLGPRSHVSFFFHQNVECRIFNCTLNFEYTHYLLYEYSTRYRYRLLAADQIPNNNCQPGHRNSQVIDVYCDWSLLMLMQRYKAENQIMWSHIMLILYLERTFYFFRVKNFFLSYTRACKLCIYIKGNV